ncbi:reverse transcriptase domain-containing protein [Tanacetum coccineum]|uniref:Reverse transcriptase domain-containing protein n=1 Tax=Tanacetum coccineum TaxID=301880 RepID=A0ABQ5G1V4_9ASTR
MNERCSALLLNKLPSKEKDPKSFTIPCEVSNLHIDNAIADLGASISFMPYTMYEKLGLREPKPTRMSLELADRSIRYPRGIVENVFIKVNKFILPIDFVILDMPEDSRILIILGRPFLATVRAMIDLFNKKITLRVGDVEVIFDMDQSMKNPLPRMMNATFINDSDVELAIRPSANEIDEKKPELKDLPSHLEYAYLHGNESFLVIVSSKLFEKEKKLLLQVLEKHKGAIAWKMLNIKGISPSFCTHKILMEADFKPVIQPQRRLNPKVQDVVKNKIVKLLDSGLIYPISDSPWVNPIQVVPKKGGMTAVLNDNNELIPSHTILIAPEDQDKTTFTCPYGTFAYRRMPFGLYNAPATFQRCMTTIFHDVVEDFMEVFMDDFSVFGNSFDCCIANLDKMLARCKETNLVLNWEKCHFMVKEGIVLGHKISGSGIEVDKAKIDIIAKLPYPTNVKGVRSFLWHAGFNIEIKDKKGAENLAADHLSRLKNPHMEVLTERQTADKFLDEHLMMFKAKFNDVEPWLCSDNVMRRCIAGSEIFEILAHCHSGPTRGHHSASVTGKMVYESGFFWPNIFKDTKDFVMKCDACQRSGNISSRNEMPQKNIQVCEVFDIWGLDFM